MSVTRKNPQRCPAFRKDGRPCNAKVAIDGYCIGHAPAAQEARRKGGQGTSRAARAMKLAPEALRPVFERLAGALEEVHQGELDPRAASAMASLAGAMVRVLTSGELEERVRELESRGK